MNTPIRRARGHDRFAELFAQALEIQSPAERSVSLDKACAGDAQRRAEIETLLTAMRNALTGFG